MGAAQPFRQNCACPFVSASGTEFPDSLFQLGEFADLCELLRCYGELVSLFGRIGNSGPSPWNCCTN